MASLYLLIPVSLIFCALAIGIYFWAVGNGQYDDLDSEGERILFDDEPLPQQDNSAEQVSHHKEAKPNTKEQPSTQDKA